MITACFSRRHQRCTDSAELGFLFMLQEVRAIGKTRNQLDVTSLTLAEFQQLVPPFEAAYHAHLAAWRLAGKPRTARRFTRLQKLSSPDAGRSTVLHSHLPEDLQPPSGPGAPVRHGPEQSQPVDSRPPPGAAGGVARPRRCPRPLPDRLGAAAWHVRGGRGHRRHAAGGGGPTRDCRTSRRAGVPPCAHDGTERRIVRPQVRSAERSQVNQVSLSRFLSAMIHLSLHTTVTGGTTHGRCPVH